MRKHCACCTRKHLAQAFVLVMEYEQGYSSHGWLAVGHMAEAEAETFEKWPDITQEIRAARLQLQDHLNFGEPFTFDFCDMIDRMSGLFSDEIAETTVDNEDDNS